MRKYEKYTKELFMAMFLNPLFIVIYFIFLYELHDLCKYGRSKENIIILSVSIFFYIIYFIIFLFKCIRKSGNIFKKSYYKDSAYIKEKPDVKEKFKVRVKKIYIIIALISMVGITTYYAYEIYETAINFDGKLAWFLDDLFNKKEIEFEHNNIYKDGIEGILNDIREKIDMPENLYISDRFDIEFLANGEVSNIDTLLYGKNENGELKGFLISYDINKSEDIIVNLQREVYVDYDENKTLEPFINAIKVIPLQKTISKWDNSKYGVVYSGKRSFGYNTDGIVYIDPSGNEKAAKEAHSEIIGYTVSVYVPGKEEVYSPVRYNLVDNLNNINKHEDLYSNNKDKKEPANELEEFHLSEKIRYKLEVEGAASGTRYYNLNKSTDGGMTWSITNEDPFLGEGGVASGITFISDKIGFICLSKSGGSYANLYRTDDGGLTYTKVDIPKINVELKNGERYNPFDFPEMPYEKDKELNILVGQGLDGDYNKGCKGLYKSNDNGMTWEFVEEVNEDNQ